MWLALLLVLNIHGAINSSGPVREALEELKVVRRFSASVVPGDASTLGTLKLCKEHVAWAPVDVELLAALLRKRGMVSETRALDTESLKKMGYKDHDDLAAKMVKGEMRLSAIEGLRPFFRLAPPRGGFKRSMRRASSEKGLLGSNPQLGELVRRML
jgi:large subunit ribosomal protein L30